MSNFEINVGSVESKETYSVEIISPDAKEENEVTEDNFKEYLKQVIELYKLIISISLALLAVGGVAVNNFYKVDAIEKWIIGVAGVLLIVAVVAAIAGIGRAADKLKIANRAYKEEEKLLKTFFGLSFFTLIIGILLSLLFIAYNHPKSDTEEVAVKECVCEVEQSDAPVALNKGKTG